MDMLDVHHIAIYDDLIAAKVQGCAHVSGAPSSDHPQIIKNIATRVVMISLVSLVFKYV